MLRFHSLTLRLVLVAIVLAAGTAFAFRVEDTPLTKDQIKQFLQTAKVINSRPSSKGVTHPSRLTLSDGTITHDASFQTVDEHKSEMKLASGTVVLNFIDSYKFNIAAYALAELIGMDDMLPVYVERKWEGRTGSLSWWLPVKMDEQERVAQKLHPPDPEAWNKQMYKVRVFDELIYDTDANLTNILIGPDWQIWRIDFTRAFRNDRELKTPNDLVRCERKLLERLKTLDRGELAAKTQHYLNGEEVQGVMARRDKIVARFQELIKQKGENEVLY